MVKSTYMNVMNSADLRNNLSDVLEAVAKKRQPVLVGRFGQPKAVLMDIATYNWQKQIIKLLGKIKSLTPSEIETLNILLDDRARNALLTGVEDLKKGQIVDFSKFRVRPREDFYKILKQKIG